MMSPLPLLPLRLPHVVIPRLELVLVLLAGQPPGQPQLPPALTVAQQPAVGATVGTVGERLRYMGAVVEANAAGGC